MNKTETALLEGLATALGLEGDLDLDALVVKALEMVGKSDDEAPGLDLGALREALTESLFFPADEEVDDEALLAIAAAALGKEPEALVTDFGPLVEAIKDAAAEAGIEGAEEDDDPDDPDDLDPEDLVMIAAEAVSLVHGLRATLEEAAEAFEAMEEGAPPEFVRWLSQGSISTGTVRSGVVASYANGDYKLADLAKVGHIVIDLSAYSAASRKHGKPLGRAKSPGTSATPSKAAAVLRERMKRRGGAELPRFGKLRQASRPAPGVVAGQAVGNSSDVPAKPSKKGKGTRTMRLRGNPKGGKPATS